MLATLTASPALTPPPPSPVGSPHCRVRDAVSLTGAHAAAAGEATSSALALCPSLSRADKAKQLSFFPLSHAPLFSIFRAAAWSGVVSGRRRVQLAGGKAVTEAQGGGLGSERRGPSLQRWPVRPRHECASSAGTGGGGPDGKRRRGASSAPATAGAPQACARGSRRVPPLSTPPATSGPLPSGGVGHASGRTQRPALGLRPAHSGPRHVWWGPTW